MSDLEKVIKDLEFENENLVRQIKDEIEAIDGIQKDIRNKATENEKLEDEIEKANHSTKTLHEQFKQNKDITESLKNATSLQQRHVEDMKNNLKMKNDETQKERDEHEMIIQGYTEKWLRYEAEYEKHPKAKSIRKLKLDAASLDAQGILKKEKEEAILSIVKLADMKISTKHLIEKIPQIQSEQKNIFVKIEQSKKEYEELRKKVEDDKRVLEQQNLLKPETKAPPNPTPSNLEVHTPSLTMPSRPVMSKFQMPKFSMPILKATKQLQLPRMPQVPKFASLQMRPTAIKHELKNNIPKLPRMNIQPSVNKTTTIKQFTNSSVFNDRQPKEDMMMDTSYSIPLEQTSEEFLHQKFGMEVDEGSQSAQPPSTPLSKFSFSPGQHAEHLKLLKLSPSDVYMRVGRPMFQQNTDKQESVTKMDPENEFAKSFSSTSQFMEFPQETKVLPSSQTSAQKTMHAHAGTMDAHAGDISSGAESFSFVYPTSSVANNQFNTISTFATNISTPDNSNTSSEAQSSPVEFNFDIAKTVTSPTEATFNFGSSTDFASPSDVPFSFGAIVPSTSAGFDAFQTPSTDSSQVFNFGAKAGDSLSPIRGFNFGSTSNVEGGKNDTFNFSFGANVSSPQNDSSNSFAFSF